MGRVHVAVSEAALSFDAALTFLEDGRHGALCSFTGRVRDFNLGKSVCGVSYDVFDPLALSIFKDICQKAQASAGGEINIWLEHFKGRLEIGGLSVVIAVTSPHRDEAFRACRFLIEDVKHRSPIWKQEHYHDGDSEWVQGHSLCQHAVHS